MPHSLGHGIGIDNHAPTPLNTLQTGMTLTLEPGIYFNPDKIKTKINLNQSSIQNSNLGENPNLICNWEQIQKYQNLGGIRIEDVYLITANGKECLSCNLPK